MVKRDFMGRMFEQAEMSLSIGVNVSCQKTLTLDTDSNQSSVIMTTNSIFIAL